MKNYESLSHTRYDCKYQCCLYPVHDERVRPQHA